MATMGMTTWKVPPVAVRCAPGEPCGPSPPALANSSAPPASSAETCPSALRGSLVGSNRCTIGVRRHCPAISGVVCGACTSRQLGCAAINELSLTTGSGSRRRRRRSSCSSSSSSSLSASLAFGETHRVDRERSVSEVGFYRDLGDFDSRRRRRKGPVVTAMASAGGKGKETKVVEKFGIRVEHNPSEERLKELGVRQWPKWGCPPSKFPWTYDAKETCYLLQGEVCVTPEDEEEGVSFGKGDLVVFPKGMNCTWDVRVAVDKHYDFE